MAKIVITNLSKTFESSDRLVTALDNISLEIADGSFVSIVGPSGCGKSTLLNILAGVDKPTSGSTQFGDAAGPNALLGYVFQDARLLPWRTVLDNLLFVQKERGKQVEDRALRYLEMVGLQDVANSYPGELSGGMQQRVGIARAFSIEPSALLMDEPFSHLDAISAAQVRLELQSVWQATKKTILFVTHDVGEAVELSERIIVLRRGGRIGGDLDVDLPFPRRPLSVEVTSMKASVFDMFADSMSSES